MRILVQILLLISMTSVVPLIHASDFHSARTAALGGSGHANPLLSDAIYLNPSYSSFIQTHSLSGTYQKFKGTDSSTPFEGRIYNISVLDGAPDSLFQAGLGFTQKENQAWVHLAASKALSSRFSLGIGAKLFFPESSPQDRFTDITFSFTSIISDWFQLAFIADNLLRNGSSQNLYRELTLATKLNIQSLLLIYIDPHWLIDNPIGQASFGYETGLEIPFLSDFFIRGGKFTDSRIPFLNVRGSGFGLGLGWLGPKLSLDYGFSRVLQPSIASSHEFGLTIYF